MQGDLRRSFLAALHKGYSMKLISGLFAAAALAALSTGTASAAVLYDNGPLSGTQGAAQINFVNAISNSFTLAQDSIVTGVNFGAWADLGQVINAVQWRIASRPFSYPVDGTATVDNGKE